MHKLRLAKGKSYHGIVCATKQHPEILVQEEEIYQAAMASGYFEELPISTQEKEETKETLTKQAEVGTRKESTEQAAELDNRKGSTEQATILETNKEKMLQEQVATKETQKDANGQQDTKERTTSIEKMSVEELRAYAMLNGIPLSGLKKKEAILAAIDAAETRAAEARNALRTG